MAATSAALFAARLDFLRAFGPTLGLTVLVSLLVAISFVPAVMTIACRFLYGSGRGALREPSIRQTNRSTATADGDEAPSPARGRLARLMTAKPVATIVGLACVAGLVAAAWGLGHIRFGFTVISGLPPGSEPGRAAAAVQQGFAPGILSPTELLFPADRTSTANSGSLRRCRTRAGTDPRRGPAGALGPALPPSAQSGLGGTGTGPPPGLLVVPPGIDVPADPSGTVADLSRGLLVSEDGTAARMLVDHGERPAGAERGRYPEPHRTRHAQACSRSAGLPGVRATYAGDTALASDAIRETFADLARVAAAALVIALLLLIVYLRGLVAPIYLLAASVLALAASLGLTAYLFQDMLGYEGITYYIPFGAAVLLVSLGSDYNIFVVGRGPVRGPRSPAARCHRGGGASGGPNDHRRGRRPGGELRRPGAGPVAAVPGVRLRDDRRHPAGHVRRSLAAGSLPDRPVRQGELVAVARAKGRSRVCDGGAATRSLTSAATGTLTSAGGILRACGPGG